MIKNFFKKITGIAAIEQAREQAEALAEQARQIQKQAEEAATVAAQEAIAAQEAKRYAALSPKEQATEKGEPWVAVLDTKVNADNPRNGFFELDWNEHFILQLKQAGYGSDGDPEEEIVDRWFRDLTYQMFVESGQDPTRAGAGYINVVPISQERSEVS